MLILKNSERITKENVDNVEAKYFNGTVREIIEYAIEKKIEAYQVFKGKLIFILKKGSRVVWIKNALTSKSNPIGMEIAKNKNTAKEFLRKMGYPVPGGLVLNDTSEVSKILKKIKYPVVVKPLSASGGDGVTVNIKSKKLLLNSLKIAKRYGSKFLIEDHLPGDYYRLTCVADGSYAATKNLPAFIVGNGKSKVTELIKSENRKAERFLLGRLKKLKITEKTKRFLATEGYTLSSVLPRGKKVALCFSGFDGGEYIDVTEKVHPYFLKMGREIITNLGLPIVGIDIITTDIARPLTKTGGVVIEINGTYPDIAFHSHPTSGRPVNLAPKLVEYLLK